MYKKSQFHYEHGYLELPMHLLVAIKYLIYGICFIGGVGFWFLIFPKIMFSIVFGIGIIICIRRINKKYGKRINTWRRIQYEKFDVERRKKRTRLIEQKEEEEKMLKWKEDAKIKQEIEEARLKKEKEEKLKKEREEHIKKYGPYKYKDGYLEPLDEPRAIDPWVDDIDIDTPADMMTEPKKITVNDT